MEEKKGATKPDFVKWFSELNKDSGKYAGGKGANLAEIYNLKVAVPPGFVVTAQAYDYFIEKSGIKEKIEELLERIDYEDTKQLDEITKQIRVFIVDSKFPKEMEEEVLESYEHLGAANSDVAKGSALDILNVSSEPTFVAVRSSATAEDLADASFAGQQDSFVNVKGNSELIKHIKKCFASLYTSRATYYRNKKGFKHAEVSLAVVVQKMVDSDKSGVIFSKDPSYKNDDIIMEAVWGLGEGIVSGAITPDKYIISKDLEIKDKKIADKKIAFTRDSSGAKTKVKLVEEKSKHQVLKNYEIEKLSEIALKLEEHYGKPQDIEFAIEGDEIFIVQTRPITTMGKRIEKGGKEIKGEPILEGLAASPGIAVGKVKIIEDLADLDKIQKGDVLVTKMTNPDMVVTMQKSTGIITDEGGLTAHAAIVSREMGIPCIVGTQEATTKLKENEIVTLDGYNGKIYRGKVAEAEKKEVLPVTVQTKTQIKVIVDLPTFAERASKTGLKKVGLTRMEGIIAESGKHPQYFLQQNKIKDYEEVIFKGIQGIAKYFDEMWIRTSDIRTDEFQNLEGAPKEIEANPMLGMHGIRYSLKYPEILKAELNALKRIAAQGKTIGLLLPQVILVEEVQKVKEYLKEINFNDAKIGVMVETPAAVQLIRDLCEEGIDFISFGTNDLTQYMLALDRGNEEVQHLYNEMHPAILYQLGYVIRVCKKFKVETSICGQAGSKKEMAKFLVSKGIDSISVNADVAKDISEYVLQLEEELVKGTDKEPRQYEVKKQETAQKEIEEKSEETEKEMEQEVEEDKQAVEEIEKEVPTQIENPDVQKENTQIPENEKPEITAVQDKEQEKQIEKDIDAIEEEKNEYLENNSEEKKEEAIKETKPEEITSEQGMTEEEITEDIQDIEEEKPEFNEETLKQEQRPSEEQIEKDIDAIEEEKKEYLENNSEEKKEEPVEEKEGLDIY
jgi:pyruvate, water dikinase